MVVICDYHLYPIIRKVLYEVVSLYGYAEKIKRHKRSIDCHAPINFSSRRDARRAIHELQGRHIYDDYCELGLWPNCGASEAIYSVHL